MIGMPENGYFYGEQLRTYVLQFMAIFTGLQVKVGATDTRGAALIPVPISYGAPDRVVAAMIADFTQNKPLRVPTISAYVRNIQQDVSRMHGVGFDRRTVFTPVGGLAPDDTKVVHQRMPVPYELEMELAIYVSNTDQHFQILEQILPYFEPQLSIQTSDGYFDMKRLTTVELTGVNVEMPYPIGTDRRIIQSSLTFKMPIHLEIPANIRNDFIKQIKLRVGAVSSGSTSSLEMITELDEQNIPYTVVAEVDQSV